MSNYSVKRKALAAFLTNTLQMNHECSIDAAEVFNDAINLINRSCTEKQKAVIFHRFACSRTIAETAFALRLTESAVQKLLIRALDAIAANLEEESLS